MRRKCRSKDTKAIGGGVERNMWVAIFVMGFLAYTACVGPGLIQPIDDHNTHMRGCDDGGMCLSELPYVPGERFQVSVSAIEFR